MTNNEIFIKVVEKAKNNGYSPIFGASYSYCDSYAGEILIYKQYIFSHEFAEAFWGEEEIFDQLDNRQDNLYFEGFPIFQYHLQQMVIEKEPLKYLEKFL